MKILKEGKLPPVKRRIAACTNCGCEVEVNINDKIKVFSDQRDGSYEEWVLCPTKNCRYKIILPGTKWEYN